MAVFFTCYDPATCYRGTERCANRQWFARSSYIAPHLFASIALLAACAPHTLADEPAEPATPVERRLAFHGPFTYVEQRSATVRRRKLVLLLESIP